MGAKPAKLGVLTDLETIINLMKNKNPLDVFFLFTSDNIMSAILMNSFAFLCSVLAGPGI